MPTTMTTSPSQPLKIAITGGDGLIGTAVISHALFEGHTVVALDRSPKPREPHAERYTYHSVNLTDYEAFKTAVEGCDSIVHLAAIYNKHDGKGNSIDEGPQHEVHNMNVSMSYNALSVASALGINRIVLASSVNAIGMVFSKRPHFDYLPVDEKHPFYPEDAYSLSKYFVELQSDAFIRTHPQMRIATLRFHYVVPPKLLNPTHLDHNGTGPKDLWGFVSTPSTARACLLALTVSEEEFPKGHETFFIAAPTTCRKRETMELVKESYPEIKDFRRLLKGNDGLLDCSKAKRMLGWTEEGFVWDP